MVQNNFRLIPISFRSPSIKRILFFEVSRTKKGGFLVVVCVCAYTVETKKKYPEKKKKLNPKKKINKIK